MGIRNSIISILIMSFIVYTNIYLYLINKMIDP